MILNTHPENRKEMVKAICELTGLTSTYMGMPSAAYQIGPITVSRDGSIDCGDEAIITKSVSRFARNTVDTLTAIRRLKEHGVEVYFEEQNIYTLDGKGELLLTIMSSIAQEESRNISENVTWGIRKRFADGKVSMPYHHSTYRVYDR